MVSFSMRFFGSAVVTDSLLILPVIFVCAAPSGFGVSAIVVSRLPLVS